MATTLGISAARLTVNGVPVFPLGLTYFDALHCRESDLVEFQARGFTLVRCFLDWVDFDGTESGSRNGVFSYFNSDGTLKSDKSTLLSFIRAAADLGMLIDLTLLHASTSGWLTTGAARTAAVENCVSYFGNEPNVLFDLVNEAEECSFVTAFADITAFVNSARGVNPNVILTCSLAPNTLGGDGPLLDNTTDAVDTSATASYMATGINLYCYHMKGNAQWWYRKFARVANVRTWLDGNGYSAVPIYFNEDNRWGTGYGDAGAGDIAADSYLSTMLDAKRAGAANYLYHSSASEDLNNSTTYRNLFKESPAIEQSIYDRMGEALETEGIQTRSALLDDFNRANEGPPPSARWVVNIGTGLKVLSNAAARNTAAEQGCTWGAHFYKDQEASFTIATATPPNPGSAQAICLRLKKPYDFTSAHYEIDFNNSAGGLGTIQVYQVDDGAGYHQLGVDIVLGVGLAIGDICKASIITDDFGVSTITVYVNGTSIGTRTDSALPNGGYTAIRVGTFSTAEFDNYTAGAIYSDPVPMLTLLRRVK